MTHGPHELKPAGGELGENEHPWASAFIGVRVEYTSKKCEGISLVSLNATRFECQERTRGGTCGRNQPYCTGAPSHMGGVFTACSWGC